MSKESLTKSQIIFVYIIASFLQLCSAFQPSPCSSNISQEHRNLYSSIGAIDENMGSPRITKQTYGTIGDRPIQKFTLTNKNRISVEVMEYGAILISCKTANAEGKIEDLTHGFETLDDWVNKNSHFFGASIGRFGNRIAHGKFELDGQTYELATNNDPGGMPCSLHGGAKGFDKVIWKGEIIDDTTVKFVYTSEDKEEGYPGTVMASITYSLNDDNELMWKASATTDKKTIVNMVHHSYWNLSGNPEETILDHNLVLNASSYLPTNKGLIPTGEICSVKDTPMDFTSMKRIGDRIDDDFDALKLGAGYDHCWVIGGVNSSLRFAARVEDQKSGRVMEIFTDQPGIQFYTSNFLDGTLTGKRDVAYGKRTAFCLETQRFPDSPNQPSFSSSTLLPGETYSHTLIHKFSTKS